MRDETLAELLRSPLDDPPRESGPPRLVPFFGAVVVGAILAAVWITGRETAQPMVVADPTMSAVGDPSGTSPSPPGLVAASDAVAVRPLAAYEMNGNLTIVVATIGEPGVPADQTPVFAGGVWQLRDVEGRIVEDYVEVRNPEALGIVAVRFESGGASQPRTLAVTPLSEPEVIMASVPIDLPGFPFVTGRSFEVPLAPSLRLSGVLLRLTEEGGDARWDLRGAGGLAQVDIQVALPESAEEDGSLTRMVSEHTAPPYPFQRQRLPRPVPLASGADVLRRIGPAIVDPSVITRAVMDVTVHLYRTEDDAQVEIDLVDLLAAP